MSGQDNKINRNEDTEIVDDPGNCIQECVAWLFDVHPANVPHFLIDGGDMEDWFERFDSWLRTMGLYAFVCHMDADDVVPDVALLTLYSTKEQELIDAQIGHAVVTKNGEIVFDPYPEIELDSVEQYIVIGVANPNHGLGSCDNNLGLCRPAKPPVAYGSHLGATSWYNQFYELGN